MVRLEPSRIGRRPPAVSWTSWLAPLKLFPCKVTLVLKLLSLIVPPEILDASRAVRPEPSPMNELAELEKVLMPVKVWSAFSLAI